MRYFLLILVTLIIISCEPEDDTLTINDYKRAVEYLPENIPYNIYYLDVRPNWLDDSVSFWYKTNTASGTTFNVVKLDSMKKVKAFDHERLADSLQVLFDEEISAKKLRIDQINYITDDSIKFTFRNKTFLLKTDSYTLNEVEITQEDDSEKSHIPSPDGRWLAFIKDHNLYIRSSGSGHEVQLSYDGNKNYDYANYYGWGDVIRGEDGFRKDNFWVDWSPDSKKIYTNITDFRTARKMYLLDWSIDSLYRPDLLYYYRASPGDTNLVYQIPVIFDIESRQMIKIDMEPKEHFNAPDLSWSDNGEFLYGRNWHRGYKRLDFIEVNPVNGRVRIVGTEKSETNIEIMYSIFEYVEKTDKVIFSSERSGWNMLYSMEWGTGKIEQITHGSYFIKDLEYIDEENEVIYFTATGKESEINPYLQFLYRIKFDGAELRLLTPENANHIVDFSIDGKYILDNYSRLDQPTISVIRNVVDGMVMLELGKADISILIDNGWQIPRSFTVKANDGITDIYGALWLPSNFDKRESYPIIDYSYTGPHTSVYPKSFNHVIYGRDKQSIAELGFITMVVDGRGSAMRSKKFHDYSYGRLGFNLQDHIVAIEQLSEMYSWIDKSRVGIYGHSAGGYDAAHALLQYPDFYKVAVSSSADHDHRMEKAWWPEMYMGWPVDSQYHQQSNITMAGNLKGKLLITHGGIDENVNPSATFKLAEALIKADKDFDMLILPGMRHGYTGAHWEYFTKRKWNYFVEHLQGKEPLWDFEF
jgi:dipeptidyl-peptidase-4